MRIHKITPSRQILTKIVTTALFLFLLAQLRTTMVFAHERESERGYNGPITKESLQDKFCGGESVKGYIINGKDVIDIIEKTDCAIEIEDAIIEKGLDFKQLPEEVLSKENLTKDWDDQKKEKFMANKLEMKRWLPEKCALPQEPEKRWRRPARLRRAKIVTNKIAIINSEIRFEEQKSINLDDEQHLLFLESVSFRLSVFNGEALFRKAIFSDITDFSSVTFNGDAKFQSASFIGEDEVNFSFTVFKHVAVFHETPFRGGGNFINAVFGSWAYFAGATFKHANFSFTTFSGDTLFLKTIFCGKADFRAAIFAKVAYFKEAKVLGTMFLKGADIKFLANFQYAEIGKFDLSSSFEGTTLPTVIEGRMDFREAIISEAHFQDITFKQDVDFSDVQFGDLTEQKELAVAFRFINFESNAYFTRTIFSADTTFERINFEKDADFTYAVFSNRHNLIFSYPKFQNLQLSWKQLPRSPQFWANDTDNETEATRQKIQPLSQVLKIFETSFRKQNQLRDANEAYYHMMDAEMSENSGGKASMGLVPAQLHMIIWKITCGYGTRIYRILGWCILFNLFFTTIYFMKGQLQPAAQKDDIFKMRLFDFPRLYLGQYTAEKRDYSLRAFSSALKLSSVILFKIGSRDTVIAGNIMGIDYKYIVWIEWLLGFYLLAALVVTLSNTVPLIHRLISGIL